jgi:hypothetical protein
MVRLMMVQPVDVATSKRHALPSQPQMAAVAGDKQGTAVIKHHHRSFPLSAQRVGDTTSLPMVGMDLDLHPNNVQARPQSPDKTESLSPPSPAPAQNIPVVSTERLIPFAQPSTMLTDSHHRHHRASQQISAAASPVRPQPALSSPQSPTKTQLLDLDTSADPPLQTTLSPLVLSQILSGDPGQLTTVVPLAEGRCLRAAQAMLLLLDMQTAEQAIYSTPHSSKVAQLVRSPSCPSNVGVVDYSNGKQPQWSLPCNSQRGG